MTRPPRGRPPPPPSTTTPLELRRLQLKSVNNVYSLSPKGMFQPVSPIPPSASDTRSISRSFSTSSSPIDEPDNSSILRGAQILRQQFMQQFQARDTKQNYGNETVVPVAERLFPFPQTDEAVHDLLGIQPIQPPGSPNDVTVSLTTQEWTDPWNLRGSAFDPAYRRKADQRHELLFGSVLPPKPHSTARPSEHPVEILPPRKALASQHVDVTPTSPQWRPTPRSLQKEDDLAWTILSEPEGSLVTGPVPFDKFKKEAEESLVTGPLPLEYNKATKKESTIGSMSTSDELSALFEGEKTPNEEPNQQAKHSKPTDTEAFDLFMEAVALDDQAFEEMLESKRDGRTAKGRGVGNKHHHKQPKEVRDDYAQSVAKKEAMVAVQHAWRQRRRNARPRASHPHNQGQSNLRDDLLCGMETNCSSEERRKVTSKILEEPCIPTCGSMDDDSERHKLHAAVAQIKAKRKNDKPKRETHTTRAKSMPSLSSSTQVTVSEEDRFGVLAPNSEEYLLLRKNDAAFQHAITSGTLWQSLVGNHVRFPRKWWQGQYRTAPLGCTMKDPEGKNKWSYFDRHRIKGNRCLNGFVKKRDEPGQILLHLVVRDFMTSTPILDIAIGCFHPNAKSIRTTEQPSKRLEDCRDVWMATRFRTTDLISVIDPNFLRVKIGSPKKSPLGDSKRKITNTNVRSIFGESPPVRTAFVLESDIYEELAALNEFDVQGPADVLLQKYVFTS